MANWRKELKELTRRHTNQPPESAEVIHEIYQAPSDRAAALLAGALAEDSLEEIIRVRLIDLGKERLDELFGPEGTLGRFSDKVRMAYAFGIIDLDLRNEFDRVREIRNTFAHSKITVRFNTSVIARACGGFKTRLPVYPDWEQTDSPFRNLYVDTVMMLLQLGTTVMGWKSRGYKRKLNKPLSLADAYTSLDKAVRQLRRRNRPNPHAVNKTKARAAPPRSSQA